MRIGHRQGGWVGLVVLLVALVIVAVLSQTLLRRMGLLQDDRTTTRTGARAPGAIAPGPIDTTGAAPAPVNAVERARGLESSVQQQSQDMTQRIDAQTK